MTLTSQTGGIQVLTTVSCADIGELAIAARQATSSTNEISDTITRGWRESRDAERNELALQNYRAECGERGALQS